MWLPCSKLLAHLLFWHRRLTIQLYTRYHKIKTTSIFSVKIVFITLLDQRGPVLKDLVVGWGCNLYMDTSELYLLFLECCFDQELYGYSFNQENISLTIKAGFHGNQLRFEGFKVHRFEPANQQQWLENFLCSSKFEKGKRLSIWGSQATNGSYSSLIRLPDWHNQVTTKLKGKCHQLELTSLNSSNYQQCQWDLRYSRRNKSKRIAPQFRIQPEQLRNGCLIKFNINFSKSMKAGEAG